MYNELCQDRIWVKGYKLMDATKQLTRECPVVKYKNALNSGTVGSDPHT